MARKCFKVNYLESHLWNNFYISLSTFLQTIFLRAVKLKQINILIRWIHFCSGKMYSYIINQCYIDVTFIEFVRERIEQSMAK